MDLNTDPFADGGWVIGGGDTIRMGTDFVPTNVQPYLNEAAWKQFTDKDVYQTDKLMREWLKEMSKNGRWLRTRNCRRYKFSDLFAILFGRPYDPREDVRLARKISKLFAYYCSTIKKSHYDETTGKWQNKTDYCISSKALSRSPYSLKLRLEEMQARGELPSAASMRLPRTITPGHSNNPRTEKILQARSERGRQAFNAYQRERRRIRAEQRNSKELADDGSVPDEPVPGQDDGADSRAEG